MTALHRPVTRVDDPLDAAHHAARCKARLAALWACMAMAAALPLHAVAADDPPAAAAAKSPLAAAREHIAAKRWQAAVDELKKVNARGDADWNNLMGYSSRKMAKPDLAAAEGYYSEALRINPGTWARWSTAASCI